MAKVKVNREAREEARASLMALLKPGQRVFCVLDSRARSGMSRSIKLYTSSNDHPGEMRFLSGYVATLLGLRRKGDAIVIRGCGMDMGFALVNDLARTLGIELVHEWL